MESEEKDNLFKFALEFCEDSGDPYEFLRILQLSLNKGSEEAKTLLGKVFAQISAAAGNGEYEKAYSFLQPLIEAGSADALNINYSLTIIRLPCRQGLPPKRRGKRLSKLH